MKQPEVFDIYARVSKDKQKGTDEEGSNTALQVELCTKWITDRGGEVGEVYVDNSISATSGAIRPGFEKMLKDNPDHPVVYLKQSRLERDPMDLDRFLLAGREGWGLDGTRATLESASTEIMGRFQSLMNRFDQRNKAEFQKTANLRRAKLGSYRGSIRPFGQERTGAWVPAEAEAVRDAVPRLLSREWTFFKVAKEWNAAGLLTPQTGKQGGREWTSGTVKTFFTRPRLYGEQEYEGKLYPLKDWPALMTREDWEALQIIIQEARTGKRGVSGTRGNMRLLTAMVKCGDCGRGMNTGYRGKKGSTRTYKCPTVNHQVVIAEKVEETVSLHALELLAHHEDYQKTIQDTQARLQELSVEKANKIIAFKAWSAQAGKADLPIEYVMSKTDTHREELAAIDAEVLALRADQGLNIFPATGYKLGEELESWETTDLSQRRELLAALFTAVHVARGEQGARFKPERVTYTYTALGEKLAETWAKDYHGSGTHY